MQTTVLFLTADVQNLDPINHPLATEEMQGRSVSCLPRGEGERERKRSTLPTSCLAVYPLNCTSHGCPVLSGLYPVSWFSSAFTSHGTVKQQAWLAPPTHPYPKSSCLFILRGGMQPPFLTLADGSIQEIILVQRNNNGEQMTF